MLLCRSLISLLRRNVFVSLLALCFVVTSCQKKESDSIRSQVLRTNIYTEPPSLDPRKASDSTSANVLIALFEGLTRIGFDHSPQPALAEKIEISEDQLTYTFTLREAYWSNGDPVTSSDFLYSWKSNLEPTFPSTFAYKLFVIKNARQIKEGSLSEESLGAIAPDARTLIVTLEHPTPYFLELTAFPTFFPIHEKTAKTNPLWADEATSDFVSNGPFYITFWNHNCELYLKKNGFYWDRNSVSLLGLQFYMIDDVMTEYYMFESNEVDWAGSPISNLPLEIIPMLVEQKKAVSYPAAATYFYKLNTERFPFNNKNIRKAFGYAICRQDIVDHIAQAGQTAAFGLVPPMPGWEGSVCIFPDGDRKQALHYLNLGLQELGITKEEIPPIKLTYNSNREHQKIAQAIQQQWQEGLGITVELENFDWKVFLGKVNSQDYQIARSSWIIDFIDPVSFLEPYYSKNASTYAGCNNETGWEHPYYRSLLDEAERTLDKEKRFQLLRQAEIFLIEEMPLIPIYHIVFAYLKKPYVHNVYISPMGMLDFKWAQLFSDGVHG